MAARPSLAEHGALRSNYFANDCGKNGRGAKLSEALSPVSSGPTRARGIGRL
jgi:hypothetical protein